MGPGWWTRKRVLLVFAAAAVVLFLATPKFPAAPRTIIMHWDYDYAHDPPCTSPSAENCVSGFRVFVGEPKDRSQDLFVPNRFDAGHHIVSKKLEATFQVEHFGYLQLCVVAVKRGPMAVMVESAPLCAKRWVLPLGSASDHTK